MALSLMAMFYEIPKNELWSWLHCQQELLQQSAHGAMALSLIASVNMKCSMLMASVNKTCSMKFPKIELIFLCCNNTLVDSLQNVGPNEKLDHSIVSPLQAKRERHTKTSSEHSSKCGTKWKTRSFHSLSLTSRERERERTRNIRWTFLQMWDQMKDHSIVSPLQAKRERDNKHLVNIPQNVGPNEKLCIIFSPLKGKESKQERGNKH
jgi:hypothetical protein